VVEDNFEEQLARSCEDDVVAQEHFYPESRKPDRFRL
jgi:hypothetical protein